MDDIVGNVNISFTEVGSSFVDLAELFLNGLAVGQEVTKWTLVLAVHEQSNVGLFLTLT